MTRDTKLLRDDEEYRLIAVYEASRAKEHAAAAQLLYPSPNLPHEAYMKLVGDLKTIRRNSNEQMLALRAHHNEMLDKLVFTSSQVVNRRRHQ
jgi:hypothetical protein